jgi:hypothetical protein
MQKNPGEGGFLLSGYLYKLKASNVNNFNPLSQVGSLWVKRFVVVEERLTRAGKECFFSYYIDEKSANDVRSAREAVPLQDIMHVSPLSTGRLNLYMSRISKLDARSKGELLQHKDLIVEVEVPFRIYFLRAEGRADMLMWAAGLQRLSGLRVEAPWPAHLGSLPSVPKLIIEHRKVSGTLPIEMYTTPVEITAPSFDSTFSSTATESSFAPIQHSMPLRSESRPPPLTQSTTSSKEISEALASSLSSASSNHFEMPTTTSLTSQNSKALASSMAIKNSLTVNSLKENKKKEFIIEGDTLDEDGKTNDKVVSSTTNASGIGGRLGLIPLSIAKETSVSITGLNGTQSLLEGALARATSLDTTIGSKLIKVDNNSELKNASSNRNYQPIQVRELQRLKNVLDDDDDDDENDLVDYSAMAKANRITTPSQIMTQYDTTLSQESKDTKNLMVQEQDHHVPEKTVYSSPAHPQTARGRFRSEQSKQQTIREDDREDDTSPPIPSSSLVDESTRPSSWMRANDIGFRDVPTTIQTTHLSSSSDDWDAKEDEQVDSKEQTNTKIKTKNILSDQEKARLRIGDPGVSRDEDILSSWD